jgi:hypothetical protein
MKKEIVVVAVAILCTMVSYRTFAQKYFAGTVKMETKYEGDIDPQKHVPHENTFTVFDNKIKQTFTGGGFSMQRIEDGDAMSVTVLYDILGYGKVGYTANKEAVEEELSHVKFSYEERSDTKTICGYECKGYNVTIVVSADADEDEDDEDDDEDEVTEVKIIVYTTLEIGKDNNINAFKFPGLAGFPLYTEREGNGVKQISQAKEVKKGKVKAVDFLIPSDYKMCGNEDEFEQEMQKASEVLQKRQ